MTSSEKRGFLPKLRFPEFRKAAGWEKELLGSSIEEFREKSTVQDEYEVLTSARSGLLRQREYFDNDRIAERDNIGFNIVPPNYLTYRSRSDDRRFYFNENNLGITGIISTYYPVFRVLEGSNKFFLELLAHYSSIVGKHSVGTSQTVLSLNELRRINLPIPKEPEQQKIADCLTSLDELITLEAQKLDTLKNHKKGLMQQLFPAEGETLPKLRFPGFRDAEEWEESPLSKYVRSLDAGVSVVSGDRPAGSNEVGILKTSAVTDGVFNPQENKIVLDQGELQRVKESVSKNSIIISRMNTPALVGTNAYVAHSLKNIFLPDRLWAARPRRNTSMHFIAFVLGSEKGRTALSKLATGTSGSMKNITKPDVLALKIVAPSFVEQQKIANCLASLDELITLETQKLDTLKTHKKGLMQQLFPTPDEVVA